MRIDRGTLQILYAPGGDGGLNVGSTLNQDEGLEMVYEKAVTLLQGKE